MRAYPGRECIRGGQAGTKVDRGKKRVLARELPELYSSCPWHLLGVLIQYLINPRRGLAGVLPLFLTRLSRERRAVDVAFISANIPSLGGERSWEKQLEEERK